MKITFFWLLLLASPCEPWTQPPIKARRLITLMIDPAGDAKNTGRLIEDTFERGLTLSFAQELKKKLEREHQNIRIVLSRFPGETLEPLQNAMFSNTLGADFYLNILFYWQKKGTSSLYLYHTLHHPVTDYWHTLSSDPRLYPYNKAYLFNLKESQSYGQLIFEQLTHLSGKYNFDAKGFWGIPLVPLTGIIAPSAALEIGLNNKEDWQRFIDPIAQALAPVITSLKGEKA